MPIWLINTDYMLTIRFFRVGKNNQPSFKIVITDKRKSSTKGRFVEEVGFYNPLKKEKILKQERIKYWLSVGAKPSPTVFNLLVSEKIIEGKKIDVHKKAKLKEAASAPVGATASQGEKPKPEAPKTEAPKEETPAPPEIPSTPESPKPVPEPPKEEELKPEAPKEDVSSKALAKEEKTVETKSKEETSTVEEKK